MRRPAQFDRHAPSGYTLIELTMALAILIGVLGALGSALATAQAAYNETIVTANTDDFVRRTLERIVSELRLADPRTVVLASSENSPSVTFSPISGWDGSNLVSGPPRTIRFVSGKVMLDGTTIADGFKDVQFSISGSTVTVIVEAEKGFSTNGDKRLVSRRLATQLRL